MTEQLQTNTENYTSELEELCRGFNHNQLRYLSVIHECSSKKEAAEALGIDPTTIYHWPSEIDRAAMLMGLDGVIVAKEIIRRAAAKAALIKTAALDSNDEKVRQDAATELLDRNLGRPTQKQQLSGPDNTPLVVEFVVKKD